MPAPYRKADAAAEELAGYEGRFGEMKGEFADVRSDLRLLKWSVGATFTGVVAILIKLFVP